MSEINSIAQGTYTLGQTSATTYQAGPGISITQPSEGTVRISNDETVLWSGTANVGTVMELSEPLFNFQTVRLENAYGQEYCQSIGLNGNWMNPMTPTFHYGGTSSGTTCEIIMDRITFVSTAADKLTFNSNMDVQIKTAGGVSVANNVNNNTQRITRVVGINRISGSNT